MLQPKRTKYRRPHRLSYEGKAKGGTKLEYGEYGLVALEGAYITDHQIEAARIVLSRTTSREGHVYIRIFPHLARTKKPAEVRMGNGKGNPEYWVALVQPGRVLYEMDGVDEQLAREAFALAAAKLPLKTKFVVRQIGM